MILADRCDACGLQEADRVVTRWRHVGPVTIWWFETACGGLRSRRHIKRRRVLAAA